MTISDNKIKRASLIIAVAVSCTWIVNLFIADIVFLNNRPKDYSLDKGMRLIILAAHQDDCVIEAGGLASQNIGLGGKVRIVYLTMPSDTREAAIRREEAKKAWSIFDSSHVQLHFLDFVSTRTWTDDAAKRAELAMKDEIESFRPDVAVIPLKEGGHPEHDLLNIIGHEALSHFPSVKVWQAAEYNPYYIMENTPTKLLWFLVRLAPFVPYNDPNYGLIPKNQFRLAMTKEQIALKIHMLSDFQSQKDVISKEQFGYPDLFETTTALPQNVISIKNKYMSLWSLWTMLQTLFVIFLWGVASYINLGFYWKYTFAASGMLGALITIVIPPKGLYEMTYFVIYLSGFLAGKVIVKYHKERRAQA